MMGSYIKLFKEMNEMCQDTSATHIDQNETHQSSESLTSEYVWYWQYFNMQKNLKTLPLIITTIILISFSFSFHIFY